MTNEDFRKKYLEEEGYSQDELDKNLIRLSGGAFAISFAFIDKLITTSPTWVILLMSSWVLWSVSILAVLLSYNYSIKANGIAFVGFEDKKTFATDGIFEKLSNRIRYCNKVSMFSFFIGVIVMMIFVSINFKVN